MGSRIRSFEAFAAAKTAAADAAAIAPLSTELDSAGPALLAIGNEWSRRLFDGPFYASPPVSMGRPATSLVFVQSREGNTVAPDPATLGGGDTDKHLIYEGLSRVAADGVLGGASTIHGGAVLSIWRRELVDLRASLGLPRHPAQILATLRGVPIEDSLLFNVPSLRVVVITAARGFDAMKSAIVARPWIEPIVMQTPRELPAAFQQLCEAGIRRLSCIGGRTLAGELIDAGLVDDLYLTTSARSAGEPDTPLYAGRIAAEEVVRKRGTGAAAGIMFQHFRLAAG